MVQGMTTRASDRGDKPEGSPRDRLLAAADELFYADGVHVVGVDRLIQEAGVARASLYTAFGSKDELVRAYLERHFEKRRATVAEVLSRYDTPKERLSGLFIELEEAVARSEFRGCRFISATAEARPEEPSLTVTGEYRTWLRSVFSDLAAEAGAGDPQRLGLQLATLYDGVAVAARLDADRAVAAQAARTAAETLVEAATSKPTARRRAAGGR
jgi:AcrR family transcriptional regulator